jgi:predicted O-methyltransferase YrrM
MINRLLRRIFLGGGTPAPNPARGPVRHMGFDIPYRLAWRTGTLQNFTEVSQKHMDVLRTYGAISEATDIVEIGCGVGRDAIALLPKLPKDGSYLGIDIMGDSIAWAQEHHT